MKENLRNRSGPGLLLSALGFSLIVGLMPASAGAAEAGKPNDRGDVTVLDQGNSESDRNITASIRKAVVDDDSLSMNAHNVKIITQGGVVTLKGEVESAKEKSAVEAKAKSVAGVAKVDSQLEVDTD